MNKTQQLIQKLVDQKKTELEKHLSSQDPSQILIESGAAFKSITAEELLVVKGVILKLLESIRLLGWAGIVQAFKRGQEYSAQHPEFDEDGDRPLPPANPFEKEGAEEGFTKSVLKILALDEEAQPPDPAALAALKKSLEERAPLYQALKDSELDDLVNSYLVPSSELFHGSEGFYVRIPQEEEKYFLLEEDAVAYISSRRGELLGEAIPTGGAQCTGDSCSL